MGIGFIPYIHPHPMARKAREENTFDANNPEDLQKLRDILAKDGGSPAGHAALGCLLYMSNEKEKMEESIPHLIIGADAGDDNCMVLLGDAYIKGEVVEKDVAKGIDFHEAAGLMGNVEGAACAANEYLMGVNIPENHERAYYLFSIAASKNSDKGFNGLGLMYLCGFHVEKDVKEAKKNFIKAKARGSSVAVVNLENLKKYGPDYDYAASLREEAEEYRL